MLLGYVDERAVVCERFACQHLNDAPRFPIASALLLEGDFVLGRNVAVHGLSLDGVDQGGLGDGSDMDGTRPNVCGANRVDSLVDVDVHDVAVQKGGDFPVGIDRQNVAGDDHRRPIHDPNHLLVVQCVIMVATVDFVLRNEAVLYLDDVLSFDDVRAPSRVLPIDHLETLLRLCKVALPLDVPRGQRRRRDVGWAAVSKVPFVLSTLGCMEHVSVRAPRSSGLVLDKITDVDDLAVDVSLGCRGSDACHRHVGGQSNGAICAI